MNEITAIKARQFLVSFLKYLLLIFAAFVALVPIVSCVVTAFKTPEEYAATSVMTAPKSWLYFENFKTAWQQANMGHAFINSFLVLICVLAGSVLISSMLAYVLNRFQFPGNGLIRNLFMIATLIPGIATQVTVYQIMTALHLVNSLPGYIILMMGTDVITIYIFLQFFENLSVSLDESAILDGCSYFGVFFKFLLPLLKAAIFTRAILKGVSTYNEYYIYALSAYYRLSGNAQALALAKELFRLIETRCTDSEGYLEAFTVDWKPESNEKLSENGVLAAKTMNTLLHVFEGYSGLYQAAPQPEVEKAMRRILGIYAEKIYSPELHRQLVFFDEHYHSIIDLYSYGHDIESSWLIDWGCSLLGDQTLQRRIFAIDSDLAAAIYRHAYRDHSVINECERGRDNLTRVWWVQAESVLGFVNEYAKSGDTRYRDAAAAVWHYICDKMVDTRPGSEGFWCLDENGVPATRQPIVEPWKCPYHNGRMCLELIRRDPDVQV